MSGHLTIGDGVQAAGRTAIVQDVAPGSKVAGVPAVDLGQSKRNYLVSRDLAGLARRVKVLERLVQDSGLGIQDSRRKKKK